METKLAIRKGFGLTVGTLKALLETLPDSMLVIGMDDHPAGDQVFSVEAEVCTHQDDSGRFWPETDINPQDREYCGIKKAGRPVLRLTPRLAERV